MKNFFINFLNEENGIETIEFVALVAVAAILIAVIVTIGQKMSGTANGAQKSIDTSMTAVDSMLKNGGQTEG